MIPTVDWLIVLGARVGLDKSGTMRLSDHMRMRAQSAYEYWLNFPTANILICGGPSAFNRYPLKLDQPTFTTPDFSEEACRKAQLFPSESAVIAMKLNDLGMPFTKMRLEQRSRTTSENAMYGAQIIKEEGHGEKVIGILSMVYHLNRPSEPTMEVFAQEFAKHDLPKPIPVYTEEILHTNNKHWLETFRKFYAKPQSHGWLWDGEEICRRLEAGESLIGIEPIKKM